jgi:hypothetical protein
VPKAAAHFCEQRKRARANRFHFAGAPAGVVTFAGTVFSARNMSVKHCPAFHAHGKPTGIISVNRKRLEVVS